MNEMTPEELTADYKAAKGRECDPYFISGWWILPAAAIGTGMLYGLYRVLKWIFF